MPAVTFVVRWPDGKEEACYSPSTVIHEYLEAGEKYSLEDFMSLSEAGLMNASFRVKQKFGYECSAAKDQLNVIRERILKFLAADEHAEITVLELR